MQDMRVTSAETFSVDSNVSKDITCQGKASLNAAGQWHAPQRMPCACIRAEWGSLEGNPRHGAGRRKQSVSTACLTEVAVACGLGLEASGSGGQPC
eukprot:6200729-Pleurochrysis_carterae.AAC.3